eukprot:gene5796-6036_t
MIFLVARHLNGTQKLSHLNTRDCALPLSVSNVNNTLYCTGGGFVGLPGSNVNVVLIQGDGDYLGILLPGLVCNEPASFLPSGNWAKSNKRKHLLAYCGPNAWSKPQLLNYTMCGSQAQVVNSNHVLTCSSLAPGIPTGSWSGSCTPMIWNRGILAARCNPNARFS